MASGFTTPDGKMYGPEVAAKAIKEACADYEKAHGTDPKDYGGSSRSGGSKLKSSKSVDLRSKSK